MLIERNTTVRAHGVDLHTSLRGDRPGAIFLHGLGDDLSTWDGVWAATAQVLPALRYDLRGFGRSIADDDAAFNHADDLLAIVDAVGVEQCDLIGVSMGGSIALNFALDHPGRVRSLVLISPGMVAWEWSERWRELWDAIAERARAGAMDEARQLWWQHPLFDTTRDSPGGAALYESIQRYSGAQWVRDNHQLMMPDVERLHQLDVRTLLLTGGRDFEDFRLIADLLEASAGDLRRVDYPELGHLLHLENVADCARQILAFLKVSG